MSDETTLNHCGNCRYEDRSKDEKPCSKCFNAFCGVAFPQPSEWATPRGPTLHSEGVRI